MYSKFKSLLLYTCRIEGLVSNFRSPDKIASHKNCHCGSSNLIPRTLILTHSAFHMPPMMHKILDKITTFLINHPQQRICVAEGNRPLLISVEGFPPRVIPSWLDTNNITFLRLFYDQNSSLLCFFWIGYCGWAQGETKTGTGTLAGSTTIEWIDGQWHSRLWNGQGPFCLGLKLGLSYHFIEMGSFLWSTQKMCQIQGGPASSMPREQIYTLYSVWAGWCLSIHYRGWSWVQWCQNG